MQHRTCHYLIALFLLLFVVNASPRAQTVSSSPQMAATVMDIWKDSLAMQPGRPVRWSYDQGVVLEGMEGLWDLTADPKYFSYIQKSMDLFVGEDGSIKTYKQDDYNIDNIKNGRSLLLLYKVTGKPKYLKAATLLREQLRRQPRTSEGGFWHKKVYPYQMWLDGLYMGEPFYAEYADLYHEDTAFNDVARQFILMERHARDPKTGLLYHGWDESRKERWADKTTGRSPNFWGRAVGWYGMALVDVLDYFPKQNTKRDSLVQILNRLATAIQNFQDAKSGLWYQVPDKATAKGNYPEASASCMFVYALAKGVRKGYLPAGFLSVARKGYEGILKEFKETTSEGHASLKGTVSVAGLGGNPYRDGSYAYYLSEKVVTNDPKGVGAFLLAGNEMAIAAIPKTGTGKRVTLDYYFNSETIKTATGFSEPFHYKWEEKDNNGFSFFGYAFANQGAVIQSLPVAPTEANLRGTHIYIIVDPDTKKERDNPNYIMPDHIKTISNWVASGGVLLLMANDTGNVEFEHFNQLAASFGIHFNEVSRNRVQGTNFELGKLLIPASNPVFKTAREIYQKEICTISVKDPAKPLYQDKGDIIMAVSKLGKGTVFAVCDPWLYNEYTDGRKIPQEYQNYNAARDLSNWLLLQVPANK